jgi:subtilase family serine protease
MFMVSRPFHRFMLPALAIWASLTIPAQAAVQNRIASTVEDETRTPLQHTIPAKVLASSDLGPAPANRSLSSITLRFNMTAAQQADLSQLLVDQQNPSSPNYHQWLTPEQFAARFGLSTADLAKVSTWLTNQGFTITGTARSATFITFTGTVAQVEKAFGTSIHSLSLDGEDHIANITDPTLPSAIAGVVTTITGLNDYKLKPRSRVTTVNADAVRPQFTSSVSGNHYIAPGDFNTIYDVNPLLSNSTNGQGITIAVMGQTDISLTDAAAFRSASGLPANAPTVKLYGTDPGTQSSDVDEAQLDVEWSGAVAPNATILYVNSKDVLGVSLTQAIDNNVAPIMSVSYGACEAAFGSANLNGYNQLFQQANAQGITVVGPSGDSGATDCDYQSATAAQGLAVDFPASSPFVTGAGGTMYNEGSGSYWNSTNGTNSGSAMSYIPEVVWNESSSSGLGASGGGASAYFTKPAWQTGPGVPNDFARDVPDIAINSASVHEGYLFCSKGSCVNGYRDSSGNLNVVGGTSIAAPTFAGIIALVEQGLASRLGNVNPNIYALANSTYYANVFHDVTGGNNTSPCVTGTTNCPNGGNIGYTASTGYDLATGWGSIDVFNLATKWKLVTPTTGATTVAPLLSTTTLSTSSAVCGISSGSLALTVTVKNATTVSAGSSTPPTPTGTIQFLVDNVAVGSPVTLSGGTATYTLTTSTLTSGGHIVSAAYFGDTTYGGSKGTLSTDVVSTTQKDFAITPCSASATVKAGGVAPGVTFTITPFNGFTGSIALSASADSPVSATYAFSPTTISITSGTAATTTFTLTAYQSGAKTATGLLKVASTQNPSMPTGRMPWYAAATGATLACSLLLILPRRRRWGALLAAILSVAALGAIGCGSSSSSTSSGSTTPTTTNATPGTYNVTVTAIATTSTGNIVHSSNVVFTVQ